jgi:hypothetical protein
MPTPQKPNRLYPALALILVAIAAYLLHTHANGNYRSLAHQFHAVDGRRIALAATLIYFGYYLRAARWAVLLTPVRKARASQLLLPQVIGFTAVSIFGRVADLTRPYLIARKLQTPLATQLAIYSMERAFDLAAAALPFAVVLALTPHNAPHHELLARAGLLAAAATLGLAAIAITIRLRGESLARLTHRTLSRVAPKLADAAAQRVLDLRHGFQTITSFAEFFAALGLSLLMWVGITAAYLLSANAFRASPPLAAFDLPATMLLLAAGLGGSLLQLPVLGWFTQIAVLAAALHGFSGVPLETATACATVIQFVTNWAILPAGLLAARLQHINLRETATAPDTPLPL